MTRLSLSSRDWLKSFLFYGFILLFAVPLTFHQVYANDIWKALYSGRYLAVFHHFPHHSTFSFSPVKDLLARDAYNWLGNLVLLGVYRFGNVTALQWFRYGILLFATLLPLSSLTNKRKPIALLLTLCYMFAIKQKLLIRTAIFSVPGMVLLFWALLKSERSQTKRILWVLPVIFLFWSNMHGSYLAGLGFLLLAWFGSLLDSFRDLADNVECRPLKLGLFILLVLAVVTYAKPFPDYKFWGKFQSIGQRTGRLLVGSYGSSADNTDNHSDKSVSQAKQEPGSTTGGDLSSETVFSTAFRKLKRLKNLVFPTRTWRSGEFQFPLSSYSLLFVSMSFALFPLAIAVFLVGRDHFRFFHFLPVLGGLILAFPYLRTLGYFPLVIFPITLWKERQGHFGRVKIGNVVQKASVVALVILAINLGSHLWKGTISQFFNVPNIKIKRSFAHRFSEKVPAYVLRHYPREQFLNDYNVSGFLIWKWWPYKRIFFDSKGSAYEKKIFRDYGLYPVAALTEKYNLDYIVSPLQSRAVYHYFIPSSRWNLVAFDDGMIVFARAEREKPKDPYEVFLLTVDEYKTLPGDLRNSMKGFLSYLNTQRNIAELELKKKYRSLGSDGTSANPGKPRADR